jgi:hypothetical protein
VGLANFVKENRNRRPISSSSVDTPLELRDWLGLGDFDMSLWSNFDNLHEWWCAISGAHGRRRKGITSLLLLTVWELWNERNARVFKNVASMPALIISSIKNFIGK